MSAYLFPASLLPILFIGPFKRESEQLTHTLTLLFPACCSYSEGGKEGKLSSPFHGS